MKIRLVLEVEDPDDVDLDAPADIGITEQAYQHLVSALSDAGFNIEEGPVRDED